MAYSYEFLRSLSRSYDIKDRRFFNKAELAEEVTLIEKSIPLKQVASAHVIAKLWEERARGMNAARAQRMRARGYNSNRARNERRAQGQEFRELS